MDNIQNKSVIITGGAAGLGYKFSEILLRNGVKNVTIIDQSISNGEKAVVSLEKEFGEGRVIFIACDVTKDEDMKKAFKKVIDVFQSIDIVINNAGINNEHKWKLMMDININAVIHTSFLALDYMGKHKGGKGGIIVNISSILGLSTFGAAPVYCASKYAVVGFSQSLAELYGKTGVRIGIICPGVTKTALIMNMEDKISDLINPISAMNTFDKWIVQSTENVALALLDLIRNGKNGAICISENNQPPYIVEVPHYFKLTQST